MDELVKLSIDDLRNKYLSNPSLIFRRGVANEFELSMAIAEGSLHLGCSRVEVEKFQNWHIVKGNHDWICENRTKSYKFFLNI